MAYQYGSPENGLARPRCWGNEREFNPNLRECRGCGVQGSCRDEILRSRNHQSQQGYPYQQPAPQQTAWYPGYQVPPPGSAPGQLPVVQGPPQPPRTVAIQPQPQQPSLFPQPQQYQYGWLHDPLYQQMFAVPPPMIPQLPGESFLERLGKNMVRDAGVAMAANLYWALRQMVLPPVDPRQNVVDVSQPPHPGA